MDVRMAWHFALLGMYSSVGPGLHWHARGWLVGELHEGKLSRWNLAVGTSAQRPLLSDE